MMQCRDEADGGFVALINSHPEARLAAAVGRWQDSPREPHPAHNKTEKVPLLRLAITGENNLGSIFEPGQIVFMFFMYSDEEFYCNFVSSSAA